MPLLLSLLTISFMLAVASAAQCHQIGAWQRLSDAQTTPVSEASCAQVGGTLYTLMGFGSFTGNVLRATADHYALDLDTGVWTRKADVPFAGSHSQAANNGTHIFLAGGFAGDYPGTLTKNVYVYAIADDAWTTLPDLPESTAAGALVYIDGKLYYFTGLVTMDDSTPNVYTLEPAAASGWQKLAGAFPDPRNHIFGARVRPDLVVLPGGDHGNTNPTDLATVIGFVPSTQEYTELADMPSPRSHADLVVGNGRLLIVGGRNNQAATGTILRDAIEYSPEENLWYTIGDLPGQRMSPCAALHTNATGTYMFVAKGGLDYNLIIKETWVAPVTVSCTYTTSAPPTSPAPTTVSTAAVTVTGTTGGEVTTGNPLTSTTSVVTTSPTTASSATTGAATTGAATTGATIGVTSATTSATTGIATGILQTSGASTPVTNIFTYLGLLFLFLFAIVTRLQ